MKVDMKIFVYNLIFQSVARLFKVKTKILLRKMNRKLTKEKDGQEQFHPGFGFQETVLKQVS